MTQRMLIRRIRAAKTESGRTVAHLFTNSRQRYPELVLFELSDLLTVGIDPDTLTQDDTTCRFWAHYEISDKQNSAGNPYRNVLHLEAIDAPASTTSTDTTAILDELRNITNQLERLHATMALIAPQAAPQIQAAGDQPHDLAAAIHAAAANNPNHIAHNLTKKPNGDAPKNDAAEHFFTQCTVAQADGVPRDIIDDVTEFVNSGGYVLATACMAAEVRRRPNADYDYRRALVARMREIMAHPLVTTKTITHNLPEGWEWLSTAAEIKRAGIALASQIEEEGGQV